MERNRRAGADTADAMRTTLDALRPATNRARSSRRACRQAFRRGRLLSFGAPPERLAELVRACAEVDAAYIAASRPGATLGEAFAAGERAYAEHGFPDEWRGHHQGGLTGYKGREVFAVPGDRTTIPARAALAWNPSIAGDAKSEDTILVGAGEPEVLTRNEDLGEVVTAGLIRLAIVVL